MFTLQEIFRYQREHNISDIHLVTGEHPLARNHKGEIVPFSDEQVTAELLEQFTGELCEGDEKEYLEEYQNLDKAIDVPEIGRFRINIFTERRGRGMNFRVIPKQNFTVEELEMPLEVSQTALGRSGLILISGPNNSGKTTILNALIDLINERKKVKVITFEDPIEYIHPQKNSLISQHEIRGEDKSRLREDLKSVFRQDANVVCLGEIRDADMLNIALEMCETGYLVMGTIHGVDTVQTLERIANLLPSDNREQLYKQLASQLRTVVCQYLLPGVGGKQQRCREILMGTDGVKNLISHGSFEDIYAQLETDSKSGSSLFDQSLITLFRENKITQETLYEYGHDLSYIAKVLG